MNNLNFKNLVIILLLAFNTQIIANKSEGTSIDSLDQNYLNWYNLDYNEDKVMGVSVDKAYAEFLDTMLAKKTIIVAVIDGGVDINHEDLQEKIWINEGEIPENGIDDDHNGYIDDINGWNFLGSVSGENIKYENLEFVRIVNQYRSKFDSIENIADIKEGDVEKYKLFKSCQEEYNKEFTTMMESKVRTEKLGNRLDSMLNICRGHTLTLTPTYKQIKGIKPNTKGEERAKKTLLKLYKYGVTPKSVQRYLDYLTEQLDYYLNVDLNARAIISDDQDDMDDAFYGNNEVYGPSAEHGTFVAGLIAANRNNGLGINGIAENVKIMVLRTVPDGDENDKDVALSIKYAVDNGANIINMSFGKSYSPNKYMVDEAIKYAEEKGVLLIHAAGNSSSNNDTVINFPNSYLLSGYEVNNWIEVGASSKKSGKELAGIFSNYGKKTVDLFAPGVDIVSLYPKSKYNKANGTSFSSPVVSGVAALVWSYYPELSVTELREILINSTLPYTKKVIEPSEERRKRNKVAFSDLSVTGGIVNAYKALELASKKTAN